jgi:phosphopantetheinyl transferase (holo-ACP synthase)
LHGGAREVQERAGIERMHVSISHSRYYAIAYAVAEGQER